MAETHHRQALRIFEESHDRRKIGWGWHNLGVALRYQEKYSEAINCYSKAATLLSELKDDHHWSMTQIGLGVTYFALDDKESAIACYYGAESIALKLHNLVQLAMIQGNLGLALMRQGYLDKAEQRFIKAIELYHSLGDQAWELQVTDGLAMTYMKQGEFAIAIRLLEEAIGKLAQIIESRHYDYLNRSLNFHLELARENSADF